MGVYEEGHGAARTAHCGAAWGCGGGEGGKRGRGLVGVHEEGNRAALTAHCGAAQECVKKGGESGGMYVWVRGGVGGKEGGGR